MLPFDFIDFGVLFLDYSWFLNICNGLSGQAKLSLKLTVDGAIAPCNISNTGMVHGY